MENLGAIKVSPVVISDIIVETLTEIDDVKGLYITDENSNIMNFFSSSKDSKKSIEIEMGETECVIELGIVVAYGCKIKEVAENTQRKLKEKIEEYTGINVREINVNIEKIEKIEILKD